MTKLSWQTLETVGDQSTYVTTIINHLKTIVPIIRNHLGSSRKYFIQFCTTFVRSVHLIKNKINLFFLILCLVHLFQNLLIIYIVVNRLI